MILPNNITKISDIVKMEEDQEIKKEVREFFDASGKKNKELQLETVIRFDLLRS